MLPRRRTETNDSVKNVKVPTEKENACTVKIDGKAVMYRITIPGRLPSFNEYISAERRNRFIAAQMKSEKQYLVGLYIRKCLPGVRIDRPVYIHYWWVEPNMRRDPSNICAFGRKVIEDALVQQHVLQDDGWDEIAGFADHFLIDKNNPRIELEIIPCADTMMSGAADTTGKDVSASTAATTTTDTKVTSDAALGTGETAGTAKRRARTTSKRRKGR